MKKIKYATSYTEKHPLEIELNDGTIETIPGQVMKTRKLVELYISGAISMEEGNYHEGEDSEMVASSSSFDWTDYISPYQRNVMKRKEKGDSENTEENVESEEKGKTEDGLPDEEENAQAEP